MAPRTVLTLVALALLACESSKEGGPAGAADAVASAPAADSASAPAPPSPAVLGASTAIRGAFHAAHLPDLLARAQLAVGAAVPVAKPSPETLTAVADDAYARGDGAVGHAAYRLLLEATPEPGADFFASHGERLLAAKEARLARGVLIEGERRHLGDARFAPLIERAMDEDPTFVAPPRELKADADLDAIKYLGGGSTITLRFIKEGEVFGAFKPKQDLKQSDFRAELAAWRLCPIMRCGFDIPRNEHVKIEWRAFSGLYQRLGGSKQKAYREKMFPHLEHVREGEKNYVHGTLKDWVPGFTLFPVELVSVWKSWLTAGGADAAMLAGPAEEGIEEIEWMHEKGEDLHRKLVRHVEGMTRGDLARQISNMLVFDYLITNWDRFSGVPAFYGANCQFKDGRIVSIDNGAAFPTSPNERVDTRLKLVQRFSRQSIQAIRGLDRERTFARLFPEPSDYDRERFDHFWSQRERLLEYVDGLIAEHGEEEVLFFP